MTTQTPSTPAAPTPRPPRTAARVVSIATIALGVAVIAGTVGSTAVSAAGSLDRTSESRDAAVAGVTELDVDVALGELTVVFGDVARAQLDVDSESGAGSWRIERDGDTLEVSSPEGSWFDVGRRASSATLTLPTEVAGGVLSGTFDVGAGTLQLDGDWAALAVDLAGGRVAIDATAAVVDVTVAGGSARAELAGVDDARFELAGGQMTALLRGEAPTRTQVEVTAGSMEVALPDEDYRVNTDAELGSLDNRLRTTSDAGAPRVDVAATFGSVLLRPAR